MTSTFAIVVTVVGFSLGSVSNAVAQAKTTREPATKGTASSTIDLAKYPAAVRATIEAQTKNATVKHVSRETEKGHTQYEVETILNGKSRDLLVDPSGKVIEIEEEIVLDDAPAPVQDALTSRGKVLKLERVVRGATTTYEASVQAKTGKKSSVALDAQGKPTKG